jgi:serralysin
MTRVDMSDLQLVKYGAAEMTTATSWSFTNTQPTDLQFDGTGMTFNAQGRALTGTVHRIGIDIGDDDFDNPDISITGIKAAAATLDDGGGSFWRFLEGNDTIIGPDFIGLLPHQIFGDGVSARAGSSRGGNDTFLLGSGIVNVVGDVWTAGSNAAGSPAVIYQGGHDTILGQADSYIQNTFGDVFEVYASATLKGGNDTISVRSSGPYRGDVAGDAYSVRGVAGRPGTVIGGNDRIDARGASAIDITGDVVYQLAHSFVRGGADVIRGGDAYETIVGDVYNVGDNRMVGGNDTLWGYGGNDNIYGDFLSIGTAGRVTAGNDTIFGGVGDDRLFGDGVDHPAIIGGNDRLFGEDGTDQLFGGSGNDLLDGGAGTDTLFGETGNDLLDGGAGVDTMTGGVGNDTYVVDHIDDYVAELDGQGIDTIVSKLSAMTLTNHVENLTYRGTAGFGGQGNALNNTIRGGAGADYLDGLGGNDTLIGGAKDDQLFGGADNDLLVGGAGADELNGGMGFDTASYAGSERGVRVSLDGSITAAGDAVGDILSGIEQLIGSSFGDQLAGDAISNILHGGGGNDVLDGRNGEDMLFGGFGNDRLTGGGGDDGFVFNTALSAGNRDVITDFSNVAGNSDGILLESAVFSKLGSGAVLKAAYFRAGPAAADANDFIVYNRATGALYYDADGNGAGAAVQFATIANHAVLTAADFWLD